MRASLRHGPKTFGSGPPSISTSFCVSCLLGSTWISIRRGQFQGRVRPLLFWTTVVHGLWHVLDFLRCRISRRKAAAPLPCCIETRLCWTTLCCRLIHLHIPMNHFGFIYLLLALLLLPFARIYSSNPILSSLTCRLLKNSNDLTDHHIATRLPIGPVVLSRLLCKTRQSEFEYYERINACNLFFLHGSVFDLWPGDELHPLSFRIIASRCVPFIRASQSSQQSFDDNMTTWHEADTKIPSESHCSTVSQALDFDAIQSSTRLPIINVSPHTSSAMQWAGRQNRTRK